MAGLSPKQLTFVAAYIGPAKKNATEAARIAGYKQPHVQGSQLLAKLSIKAAVEEYLAQIKREGIANQQNRIDELVERHRLMKQVIAERAADPFYADIPGGATGIVLKRIKNVKHVYEPDPEADDGRVHQVTVEQWEVEDNVALLRELREHEKQVAQELGEWSEQVQIDGGMRREYVIVSGSS